MPFSNYTLVDLAGSLVAIVMFFPVLFVPGYIMGWLTNCFRFRELPPSWRCVISVPVSMAVSPATIYWIGSFVGWPSVAVLYLASSLYWIWLLSARSGHEGWKVWFQDLQTLPKGIWLTGLAWMLIVLASLVDLQINHRLYFSATAYDHTVRTAITDTIARVGTHPNNPFYYLTGSVPLRYHYFWLLPCGFLTHLAGSLSSARNCIYASAVWCGWGFIALIPTTLRFLLGFRGSALRLRTYLALAFTSVTGLDLLPTLYLFYRSGTVHPDMEWWNNNQITSWWGSVLWVPHHFAALVIGIIGFLICHAARETVQNRQFIACSLLAGVALGSLVGSSVYVAVVMAAFLSLWTVMTVMKRDARQFFALAIAGTLTLAIAVPYLHTLSGNGEGGPFMTISIRHFRPVDNYFAAHHFSAITSLVLRSLVTPLNYFLELGFFFVVGIVFLWRLRRKRDLSPGLQLTLWLAATSVFISTFFRSGVIATNDLGVRGFMPAQFILLLWAADLFSEPDQLRPRENERARRTLATWGWATLLLFGVAGTLYHLSMLRVHGILSDRGLIRSTFAPDRQLGERTYALRQAYEVAKEHLADDAIIESDPDWKYLDVYSGLYISRQMAAYDLSCGAQFGGDPLACAAKLPALIQLFNNPDALDFSAATKLCKELKIDALVIKDKDGIWDKEPSWLKSFPLLAANSYARIVAVPAEQRTSDLRRKTLVARH